MDHSLFVSQQPRFHTWAVRARQPNDSSGCQPRTYHLRSRWGELFPHKSVISAPSRVRNVSVMMKIKRTALLLRGEKKKAHRNPSWSRASCSVSSKKKKKRMVHSQLHGCSLSGHVGGPVLSRGRTLWLRHVISLKNCKQYQPKHSSIQCPGQRVTYTQTHTHTHTHRERERERESFTHCATAPLS